MADLKEEVLKAIDSRSVSPSGIGALLNISSAEATSVVNELIKAGLVKTLASMKAGSVANASDAAVQDSPLALTFRGYVTVHPFIRKVM